MWTQIHPRRLNMTYSTTEAITLSIQRGPKASIASSAPKVWSPGSFKTPRARTLAGIRELGSGPVRPQ